MKYILVFLTLIWTLTKAEFDEICKHPTESLESKKAQCRGFESSRKTKLLERRKFIRPRPKFGHRSLNSEKPAVVHLVSLQRRFLTFSLLIATHWFFIKNSVWRYYWVYIFSNDTDFAYKYLDLILFFLDIKHVCNIDISG